MKKVINGTRITAGEIINELQELKTMIESLYCAIYDLNDLKIRDLHEVTCQLVNYGKCDMMGKVDDLIENIKRSYNE